MGFCNHGLTRRLGRWSGSYAAFPQVAVSFKSASAFAWKILTLSAGLMGASLEGFISAVAAAITTVAKLPQHPGRGQLRINCHTLDKISLKRHQQRRPWCARIAHRQHETVRQTRARPTTERQTEMMDQTLQPRRPPRRGGRNPAAQPFREYPLPTTPIDAPEPMNRQPEPNQTAMRRQIRQ